MAVASSPTSTYARIVEQLLDTGLTHAEVARLVGVSERQVRNWAAGTHKPTGARREALLDLQYVVGRLRQLFRGDGPSMWLRSRNRTLDGRRPAELWAEGRQDEVLAVVEPLVDGAF